MGAEVVRLWFTPLRTHWRLQGSLKKNAQVVWNILIELAWVRALATDILLMYFFVIYFEIISSFQKWCKGSIKNYLILFTQIPPMVNIYLICSHVSMCVSLYPVLISAPSWTIGKPSHVYFPKHRHLCSIQPTKGEVNIGSELLSIPQTHSNLPGLTMFLFLVKDPIQNQMLHLMIMSLPSPSIWDISSVFPYLLWASWFFSVACPQTGSMNVSSWPDSNHTRLMGIPQKWLLAPLTHQRTHNINPSHHW